MKQRNRKKHLRALCFQCLFILLLVCMSAAFTNRSVPAKTTARKKTPLAIHGRLKVKGTSLVDKKGKKVQLKGISTHGINWDVGEPFVNRKAFRQFRDSWNVNCIRIAMYTQDYNGYCVTDRDSRKKLLETIDRAVTDARALGMYVIIDWHILNDQTPVKYQKQAKAFFKKMSKKYGAYQNVLFEICNEPNGNTSWNEIKGYAKRIIKTIRKNAKKSIIIVGTPTWSQDVDVAAKSPLKGFRNIMYAVHFYAATHKEPYRDKVKTALDAGLPVICTEFSGCEASGNGTVDIASANQWISFLKENNIGFCCWSLSNKDESASLLKASCKKVNGFRKKDFSTMGNWYRKQ